MPSAADITELYFGNSPVETMYLGSKLIYPKAPIAINDQFFWAMALYGNGTPLYVSNSAATLGNPITTVSGLGTIPAICRYNTKFIAPSGYRVLAILKDGTSVIWGQTNNGLGAIPANAAPAKLAAFGWNTQTGFIVKETDGSVVSWGQNPNGIRNIPAGLVGVNAIFPIYDRGVVALKDDGTIVTWGANYSNLLSVPAGLNGVVNLFNIDNRFVAVKQDGSFVTWGDGGPLPTTISSVDLVFVTSWTSGNAIHVLRVNGDLELHRNGGWRVIDTNIASLSPGAGLAIKNDGTIVKPVGY
jgi:hypothetical protein